MGPDAFDLKDVWHSSQDAVLPPADFARWFALDLDDSKWEQGNDIELLPLL